MSNTETLLRKEILQQLQRLTPANSPNLYPKIQTEKGYKLLEQKIIERIIANGITPAAVIPQLEMEEG